MIGFYLTLLGLTSLTLFLETKIIFWVGITVGNYLQKKVAWRKTQIFQIIEKEEKEWESIGKGRRDSDEWESVEGYTNEPTSVGVTHDAEWDGIVGFFHPFCNAGGGGERVLWAAIRAVQKRWPRAKCVVYTGDHELDKAAILSRVHNRFNIILHSPSIIFLYLTKRSCVLASSWPRFTLLGQSIGSIFLAWDAFSLVIPDIFIDTMGYAFSLALCKFLFPFIPTGAYVHYPTISTDMILSLTPNPLSEIQGVNGGKGVGAAGFAKKIYWKLFAQLYSLAGSSIDVVMCNSSWTLDHLISLWQPWRTIFKKSAAVVVYPPVAVDNLARAIKISVSEEKKRESTLLYIAQFRGEKNHRLILRSFAQFKSTGTLASKESKLVLVGNVRDRHDSTRIYELRLLAHELQIKDSVTFHLDASWPEVIEWLARASIGINGMWNEHFGIGVVEYQAAGLIPVVHKSGGPYRDIVRTLDGLPTGFHANSAEEYAKCFETILTMDERKKVEMRERARKNSQRFTEDVFFTGWTEQMEKLVASQKKLFPKEGVSNQE